MVQATPHLGDLSHRTRRRMDLSQGAYDGIDEARTYFYSANWQVLEEHVDTDLDDDTDRIGQQFWGVRYIDDAVARRVDRDGDGTFTGDPEDNFFYLTDVMFSVRALVDGEGRLHTRLDYTPYGVAMHGFAADVNGDGVLNVFDYFAFLAVYNGGTALRPGETGYDPDADLYGNGMPNIFSLYAFQTRYNDYAPGGGNPTFNDGWIDNPNDDVNGPDNSVGYDGYWFDLAGATEATSTGLYMVRHRVYDPKLGRWLRRDPAGYVDGSSRYAYVSSRPTMILDPSGLAGVTPIINLPDMKEAWDNCAKNSEIFKAALARLNASCSGWNPEPDRRLHVHPFVLEEDGDALGAFDDNTNHIHVEIDKFKGNNNNAVCAALAHEMIHAADYCERRKRGIDNLAGQAECRKSACTEARANHLSCSHPHFRKGDTHEECMSRYRAGYANRARQKGCDMQAWNKAWDTCAKTSGEITPGCDPIETIKPFPEEY